MYLLDTNHCSFLIEGEANVVNHFRSLGTVIVTTSVITAGELRYMAQNSQQKAANIIKVRAFLRRTFGFVKSGKALQPGHTGATTILPFGSLQKPSNIRPSKNKLLTILNSERW